MVQLRAHNLRRLGPDRLDGFCVCGGDLRKARARACLRRPGEAVCEGDEVDVVEELFAMMRIAIAIQVMPDILCEGVESLAVQEAVEDEEDKGMDEVISNGKRH